jgi:hypothetical protein
MEGWNFMSSYITKGIFPQVPLFFSETLGDRRNQVLTTISYEAGKPDSRFATVKIVWLGLQF